MEIDWPVFLIMALAVFNGLVTSIVLETIILYKQMGLKLGLKRPWNVTNLDDLYGSCHEFNGFFSNGWGYTKLVGCSYHVGCWVYYTTAIQLLALESARERLLRLKVNWGN